MLSNAQKALIKQAQRQAGLSDDDYREVLEIVCGCRSSTDPRLSDRSFDRIMAFLEAIYWRERDAGRLQPQCKAVFLSRRYWQDKNGPDENSRDRFARSRVDLEIQQLEHALSQMGYGQEYYGAVRAKVTHGRDDFQALQWYCAALKRTLRSKQRKQECDAL